MAQLQWIGVVRHGQSTGNVIAADAEAAGAETIGIPQRDADVPLSPTGREQAAAVRHWLAGLPADQRPDLAVVSPYLRTVQTAELALAGSGLPMIRDERLRDRELGVLDLLTSRGVRARLPAEATRRQWLGKFYYRPPGGEAWTDVALRLRSLLGDISRDHDGRRVLLVGHEAIVLLVRYLLDGLTEAELMSLARETAIANCSISSWRGDGAGGWRLERFNHVEHVRQEGVEPTRQEDVSAEAV
ncbi:MAG TPA: histidine phosphatase family protein [Catenuloplanes sp.]